MKKLLRLLIVLLLVPTLVFAEEKFLVYSDVGYDNLTGVAVDIDGSYAVVGSSYKYEKMFSFIVKYDANDNILWEHEISDNLELNDIEVTEDGGFVVAGYIYNAPKFDENFVYYGSVIIKYDKDGNKVWHSYIVRPDVTEIYDIEIAEDGTIYGVGDSFMGGESSADIKGGSQAFIVELGSNGNKLGEEVFDYNGNEAFNSITLTKDGGFIVSGYTDSKDVPNIDNKGRKVPIVVKYDNNFDMEWMNHVPLSSTLEQDAGCYLSFYNHSEFNEAIQTKDGGYVAVGSILEHGYEAYPGTVQQGYAEKSVGVMVKYDKDGKVEWTKEHNPVDYSIFTDVEESKDGYLYVTGYDGQDKQIIPVAECTSNSSYDDALLIIYNNKGEYEENSYIGSKDESLDDIELPEDGGYIAVGLVNSDDMEEITPIDYMDGLIIKDVPKKEVIGPSGEGESIPEGEDEKEEVENPKTGVEDYLLSGFISLLVGGVLFNIINKKEVFKKM